ncbi:MAG: hypothetical protein OHK0031_18100 [Anaerolineales bacterium]
MRPDEFTLQDFENALQAENAPAYSEQSLTPGQKLRPAAVLAPLFRHAGAWHLLYTRRADRVETHKGQVAFPGGASEAGESAEQTALREAQEEIGLRPGDVQLLGRLPQMITISNFLVTPVVGVIPWPYAFRVYTPEVERVFSLPLTWLAESGNFMEIMRVESGRRSIAYLPRDGELLWGATAHMTRELLKKMGL